MAVEFSTLESRLIYRIEHGRVNPIHLTEGSPSLPPYPPAKTTVDLGNIVVKWNIRAADAEIATETPSWIRLSLYQPKASVTDPMAILDPPQYLGHGEKGNYTVRFPEGDDTYPTKEHSPLWQEYIEPNWEPVPGGFVRDFESVEAAERNNTEWPGERQCHHFRFNLELLVFPAEVPLRVSKLGVHHDGEAFLILFEIRRYGRLRLLARPVFVKPTIGRCVIATTVYDSPLAPEVNVLRYWRDNTLGKNIFGRLFIRVYYAISPSLARVVARSEKLKGMIRFILTPLVKRITISDEGVTKRGIH